MYTPNILSSQAMKNVSGLMTIISYGGPSCVEQTAMLKAASEFEKVKKLYNVVCTGTL